VVTKLFFQTFLLTTPWPPLLRGKEKSPLSTTPLPPLVPLIKEGQGGCIKRNKRREINMIIYEIIFCLRLRTPGMHGRD
jgi:hypothetical protein